jgi:hypothetical protein
MHRLKALLLAVPLAGVLAGCQREDPAVKENLKALVEKVDRIEKKVDQMSAGGGARAAGAAQPQARPAVDPTTVFSVPIDGDAPWGPPTAKVTLVEAYDFA